MNIYEIRNYMFMLYKICKYFLIILIEEQYSTIYLLMLPRRRQSPGDLCHSSNQFKSIGSTQTNQFNRVSSNVAMSICIFSKHSFIMRSFEATEPRSGRGFMYFIKDIYIFMYF